MNEEQKRDRVGGHFKGPYAEIPKKLKAYYDSLQDEAVPDRFLDLLERLDKAEQAAKQADTVKELD